uniref:MSP domain-containing protein n=1 Tax=Meloidogyne hapla TaxID=6305 RepID=A0A1I8BET7_MELHA
MPTQHITQHYCASSSTLLGQLHSHIAMAVQVDPPSIQLPAGGGNIALKLLNAGLESGPPKADDRLEICFTTVPPDATDARALFPPGSSGDFKLDVPLAAV